MEMEGGVQHERMFVFYEWFVLLLYLSTLSLLSTTYCTFLAFYRSLSRADANSRLTLFQFLINPLTSGAIYATRAPARSFLTGGFCGTCRAFSLGVCGAN